MLKGSGVCCLGACLEGRRLSLGLGRCVQLCSAVLICQPSPTHVLQPPHLCTACACPPACLPGTCREAVPHAVQEGPLLPLHPHRPQGRCAAARLGWAETKPAWQLLAAVGSNTGGRPIGWRKASVPTPHRQPCPPALPAWLQSATRSLLRTGRRWRCVRYSSAAVQLRGDCRMSAAASSSGLAATGMPAWPFTLHLPA